MNGKKPDLQNGFVASYLLYGIGLLAIMGVVYGRLNSGNQQVELVQTTVDEIAVQLEIITGKIMLCAAVYPDGDHGQFNARHAYPAPVQPATQVPLSQVYCPAPGGPILLSNMPDKVPMPKSPPGFAEWIYEHTPAEGIRLRIDPSAPGGASDVRTRLIRKFPASATRDGDQVVFQILN